MNLPKAASTLRCPTTGSLIVYGVESCQPNHYPDSFNLNCKTYPKAAATYMFSLWPMKDLKMSHPATTHVKSNCEKIKQ